VCYALRSSPVFDYCVSQNCLCVTESLVVEHPYGPSPPSARTLLIAGGGAHRLHCLAAGSGLIDAEQSVAGLISVLESGRPLNGHWYDFAGKEIPW